MEYITFALQAMVVLMPVALVVSMYYKKRILAWGCVVVSTSLVLLAVFDWFMSGPVNVFLLLLFLSLSFASTMVVSMLEEEASVARKALHKF
jgi:4-hydroxybenzoate polyprenyltransferase